MSSAGTFSGPRHQLVLSAAPLILSSAVLLCYRSAPLPLSLAPLLKFFFFAPLLQISSTPLLVHVLKICTSNLLLSYLKICLSDSALVIHICSSAKNFLLCYRSTYSSANDPFLCYKSTLLLQIYSSCSYRSQLTVSWTASMPRGCDC